MQIQTSQVNSNVKYGHEKAVSKESHVRVASLQWYGFCYFINSILNFYEFHK